MSRNKRLTPSEADEVLVRCFGFTPSDLVAPPLTAAERRAYSGKPKPCPPNIATCADVLRMRPKQRPILLVLQGAKP